MMSSLYGGVRTQLSPRRTVVAGRSRRMTADITTSDPAVNSYQVNVLFDYIIISSGNYVVANDK